MTGYFPEDEEETLKQQWLSEPYYSRDIWSMGIVLFELFRNHFGKSQWVDAENPTFEPFKSLNDNATIKSECEINMIKYRICRIADRQDGQQQSVESRRLCNTKWIL